MKPPAFEYERPESLGEAVKLLGESDNAKILAGGQSLIAMLNLRYLLPDLLVDINAIGGLDGIAVEGRRVRIGAMARQRDIERHSAIKAMTPIFGDALPLVGHRQTRNRGTIGGSLCHLDPAAELPCLALLHDAQIEVTGAGDTTRSLAAGDFIAGFMMPNIEPHEIVSAIEFEAWAPGHGHGFHEFSRRHGDFAIASAACQIEIEAGTVSRAAIVIGGVGSVPQRLRSGEATLAGSGADAATIEAVLECCADLEIIADFHGSVAYRLNVARAMLRRSLVAAVERAGGRIR